MTTTMFRLDRAPIRTRHLPHLTRRRTMQTTTTDAERVHDLARSYGFDANGVRLALSICEGHSREMAEHWIEKTAERARRNEMLRVRAAVRRVESAMTTAA